MVTSKEYSKIVKESSPKSKTALSCVRAYRRRNMRRGAINF